MSDVDDSSAAELELEEQVTWYYKDEQGLERGPYTTEKMNKWRDAGHLPPTLLVRSNFVTEWVELAELPDDIFKPEAAAQEGDVQPVAAVDAETTTPNETGQLDVTADATSSPTIEPAAEGFCYKDSAGAERGPYSETQMRAWYQLGWFGAESNDVQVRHSSWGGQYRQFSECTEELPFTNQLEERWYYVDRANKEQGPFRTLQMEEWYRAKALPPALKVRQIGEPTFTRLDAVPRPFTAA